MKRDKKNHVYLGEIQELRAARCETFLDGGSEVGDNLVVCREPFSVTNDQNPHPFVVMQVLQEFWCDHEVSVNQSVSGWSAFPSKSHLLSRIAIACDVDQLVVHNAFGSGVHTLVDLIDKGERNPEVLRHRHEVHDGGQRTFLSPKEQVSVTQIHIGNEDYSLLPIGVAPLACTEEYPNGT